MSLTSFSCGHVGRTNNGFGAKAQAFIRVAEIRNERVDPAPQKCPDCKRRDSE